MLKEYCYPRSRFDNRNNAQIILQNGLTFSPQVAENLLTGIITDTIGFRTTNMKPAALRLAADLVEAGANLPELYMKL